MSAESKTAKAARTAVAKGMAGKKDERTPAEVQAEAIKNLRGLRAAGGHVSPTDVDQLLAAYDHVVEYAHAANLENETLNSKLEEFRSVYEAENRSTSLTVERASTAVEVAPYTDYQGASEHEHDKALDAAAAQVSET